MSIYVISPREMIVNTWQTRILTETSIDARGTSPSENVGDCSPHTV